MPSTLIANYESALANALKALGEKQFTRRLFVHTAGLGIWRGVFIGLNSRRGRAIIQPNLAVFCPAADNLVREGLRAIYQEQPDRTISKRIGHPVLSWPLYDLVRKLRHLDRMPYAYDVVEEQEINNSVEMIANDYIATRLSYFGSIDSLESLEERLMRERMPSSGMYAMAVGHLLNGPTGRSEIAARSSISPNEMTHKFAEWYATVYGNR